MPPKGSKAAKPPEPVKQVVTTEEEELEEKKKNDTNKGLPGDPTWSIEDRLKVLTRIRDSGTPLGLRDYAFDANAMVADAFDTAMPKVFALHDMMDSITQAARKMRDEDWVRFQELPCVKVHEDDQTLHGAVFASKEPTWKTLLQKPKKTKQTCVFLHMGTEPPTQTLSDFLTKLGWYGVCIGPLPPPPGNEDLVQFTQMDPGKWSDQKMVDDLTSPGGGKVPRPAQFGLAFVNVTFNVQSDADFIDPYDEKYQEKVRLRAQKRVEMAEKAEKAGTRSEWQWEEASHDTPMPEPSPGTATGWGKVGVSRGERVRRRLRALKNSLKVALHRLQKEGSLVVFWPGLPLHPVLFFLAGSLRKVFQRVHVVTSPGSKTFDIYILCVNFNRAKAEDQTPGIGGLELKSFLDSAWRSETLDDVLLWTLAQFDEEEEISVGASGRGIVASYADLWTTFSEKFRALALDLGVVILGADGVQAKGLPPSSTKGGAKAKAKAKAKAAPEKSDVSKEEEDPEESKKTETEKGSAEAQANPENPKPFKEVADGDPSKAKAADADPSSPKEDKKPKDDQTKVIPMSKAGETSRKDSKERKTSKNSSKEAKQESPGETGKKAADAKDTSEEAKDAGTDEKGGKDGTKTIDEILIDADNQDEKKPRFKLTRCVPTLSGSLGASPGHKHMHPDYVELAGEWPLVNVAWTVGKRGRIKKQNKQNDAMLPALSPTKAPPYFTNSSPTFTKLLNSTSPSSSTAQARSASTSRTGMLNRAFSTPTTPSSKLSKALFPSSPNLRKT